MAYANITLFDGENIVSPPQGDPLGLLGSVLQFQNFTITTGSENLKVTTLALGEEDISFNPPLMPYPTTKAIGEEDSIPIHFQPTTLALGEEESSLPPLFKVRGKGSSDDLIGSSEADHIDGMGGDDYVFGNRGNDFLFGGAGADEVHGGDDDDVLGGGEGIDLIDGGSGKDTADFSEKRASVTINLLESQVFSVVNKIQEDRLISIENLIGGLGADILSGDDGDNVLAGAAGNDILAGRGGNNVLIGGTGNDLYILDTSGTTTIVENKNQGVDTIKSSIDINLVSFGNIENLLLEGNAKQGIGNDGRNVIEGNASDNFIDGGSGNDVLIGGLGNDLFFGGQGSDTIDGGEGIDTLDYGDRSAAIRIALRGSSVSWVSVDGRNEDSIKNIESLISGKGRDILIGDLNNNLLMSGAGDDLVRGGQGDDILNGGDGIDTVDFSDKSRDISVALNDISQAVSVVIGSENDVISNFENITGGSGNDRFAGNSASNTLLGGLGDDVLIGYGGADILTGGAGRDTFRFERVDDGVDRITDFVRGTDKISLNSSEFANLNGVVRTANFKNLTQSQLARNQYDSDDYLIFNMSNRTLYYDADGNGGNYAAVAIATFSVSGLGINDFVLAPTI